METKEQLQTAPEVPVIADAPEQDSTPTWKAPKKKRRWPKVVIAVLLVLEKLVLSRALACLPGALRHGYLLLAAVFSFAIFNGDGISGVAADLSGMLGLAGGGLISTQTLYYLSSYAVLLVIAVIGATPLPKKLAERFAGSAAGARAMTVLQPVILLALLAVCTAYLVDGSFNPFLYFRF